MVSKRTKNRPTASATYKRGRPESIPWDIEMPFLVESRKNGKTYAELADYLSDRYNKPLTPQIVRGHVSPNVSKQVEKSNQRAREIERENIDNEDSFRLASWLIAHPSSTRRDASESLNMPLYRVENLMDKARTHFDGYLIPPVKQGVEQFTENEMLDAIRMCAKSMGIRKNEPISQYRYADWRKEQNDDVRENLPSPVAFRRRFGTWTNACELAGLQANPLPKTYTGLTPEDIVVWLAVWLRDLKEQKRGLVDASQGEYRQWVRNNPEAPSEELVRMKGMWAHFLSAASILEKTTKKLPIPKAVSTEGRVKKTQTRRRIPTR